MGVWAPFMVGRATQQMLHDISSYLSSPEAFMESLSQEVQGLDSQQGLARVFDRFMWLMGRDSFQRGVGLSERLEARMTSLSPLNRLAARLESALTGLELGDWFSLCLGYGDSCPHSLQTIAYLLIDESFFAAQSLPCWIMSRGCKLG